MIKYLLLGFVFISSYALSAPLKHYNPSVMLYGLDTYQVKLLREKGIFYYPWLTTLAPEIALFEGIFMPPHNTSYSQEWLKKWGLELLLGKSEYDVSNGYLPIALYERRVNPDNGEPSFQLCEKTEFGTLKELKTFMETIHSQEKVKTRKHPFQFSADVVLNHMYPLRRDKEGHYVFYHEELNGDPTVLHGGIDGTADDYGKASGPPKATPEQYFFYPTPNLNHTHEAIQALAARYISLLLDLGFNSLRVDFAKGIEPEYVAQWFKTLSHQDQKLVLKSIPVLAEIWESLDHPKSHDPFPQFSHNQDAHRLDTNEWTQKAQKEYDSFKLENSHVQFSAFDFTLRGMILQAVNSQNFKYLIDPNRRINGVVSLNPDAILFIDNHDTVSPHGFGPGHSPWEFIHKTDWEWAQRAYLQAYAFILMAPVGIPSVYIKDFFFADKEYPLLKETIKKLIIIRNKLGIGSKNKDYIMEEARQDYFRMKIPLKPTQKYKRHLTLEMGPDHSLHQASFQPISSSHQVVLLDIPHVLRVTLKRGALE